MYVSLSYIKNPALIAEDGKYNFCGLRYSLHLPDIGKGLLLYKPFQCCFAADGFNVDEVGGFC